jgi:hypothetical protein
VAKLRKCRQLADPVNGYVLDFHWIKGTPGRPKELADDFYGDRGYDSEGMRALLRRLGIVPHIAEWRVPHGSELGRAPWLVERTISWLKGHRRLRSRYDCLRVIVGAWRTQAGVIRFRRLHHDAV